MSDKKSKSKSKQKAEKPPKSKKSKEDKPEPKAKKSAEKSEKGSKKSKEKPDLDKSRISKAPDDSQTDFSIFKPFGINPPTPKIEESLCPFHNDRNTIFCEVCEQVGCENCLVYGPHNNQMHRVTKLDEAFKARYLFLNEIVCNDLLAKREEMNQKIEDINVLTDELRFVKASIEKLTRMEYNETMERLHISAGNKFAILNHEMACLQQDLEAINTLGNEFFQLTNMNPENSSVPEANPNKGMVPFLLRSKLLQEQAEDLISKPIKTTVEVFPYDLPREVAERSLMLEKNKGWLDLLRVKDQVIWNLLEEKKNLKPLLWEAFNEQAHSEMEQWQQLNQKLRNEVDLFAMKCSKCRTELSEDSVNEECSGGQFHQFQSV